VSGSGADLRLGQSQFRGVGKAKHRVMAAREREESVICRRQHPCILANACDTSNRRGNQWLTP
jgi:hypothetical protein